MKLATFLVAIAWLAGVVGWVMNLVDLVQMCTAPGTVEVSGLFIGRIVGLFFFPLGAVLGFF